MFDDRLVAARVLGRHLALAERGVRELPVAGAVADRVDVRHARPPMVVGGDALPPVELDAGRLEADALDERAAADGDEHQVAVDRLAVAERHAQLVAVLLDAGALLAELQRDPALPERLRELLRRVRVLLRDQRVEHLDDRHLGAERLKIDANSAPMIPPPRMTSRRGTSVWASSPVESTQRSLSSPGIGGRSGNEPGRDDRALEVDVLAAVDRIVFGPVNVPAPLTHSTPFALKSDGDAAGHLLDDRGLPLVRLREVELRLARRVTPSLPNVSCAWCMKCAVCTHALVGMHPTRRQVPPSSGSFSMHATLAPSCAARIAAV